MNPVRVLIMASCLLSLAVGCRNGEAPQSPSPFDAKLEAALAISDSFTRDATLVKLAKEAAGQGDGPIVKKALAKISDSFMRDSTASSCADALIQTGKSNEAVQVAKSISDTFLRDAALKRLAGAKTGDSTSAAKTP